MKKLICIFFLFTIVSACLVISCRNAPPKSPGQQIADMLAKQTDSFAMSCRQLQTAVETPGATSEELQNLFLQARLSFKRFEWAANYFEPVTTRFVNGAPVEEAEQSGQVFEPEGLQVIETFLFPVYDSSQKTELLRQLSFLPKRCARYKSHFTNVKLFDWQIWDAAKLEVFRVETVGITGFDDPLSLRCLNESAAALAGLQSVLSLYRSENKAVAENIQTAVDYLHKHSDFDNFNRADFIINCANPLSKRISGYEENLHMNALHYNRLLNQSAQTLFDTNAFNPNAYSPDMASFATPEKIVLGKKLFADPMLSGNGTRSCQSCHQPGKAFSDGLVKNTVIDNNTRLKRNTPTLLNAALQSAQFYDLRVNTLEDQSLDVVQNTVEMHGSMLSSVQKLWKDSSYRNLFARAFPTENRKRIDTLEVMNAIGSYVRSLVKLNSRFDEYMRGNASAMNAGEVAGFNLFMGKARCGTCHYMPLFNGTFPPRYMKTEAEVIGVPQTKNGKQIDGDEGRYEIIPLNSYQHAFKTPTVRNAALTAPYMHNGVFTSLEEVIDFYDNGGGAGLGIAVDNQTLPFDKLNLTITEKQQLVAFLKSLTSR